MSPENIAGLTIPTEALAELHSALDEMHLAPVVPHTVVNEIREPVDRPAAAAIDREAA
jgi:hypothetical protein